MKSAGLHYGYSWVFWAIDHWLGLNVVLNNRKIRQPANRTILDKADVTAFNCKPWSNVETVASNLQIHITSKNDFLIPDFLPQQF